MSLLLHIDTAVAAASVCLSRDAEPLGLKINPEPRDSAAWIQLAIKELLEEKGVQLSQVNAISVSAGPGSYTGLRVGMASAKGLCYALQIPLITINTLQMMAAAATGATTELLCPMIDARRQEVFTAVYDRALQEVQPASALILQPDSFAGLLEGHTLTFFGNGSPKFEALLQHPNAVFASITADATQLAGLAFEQYSRNNFADLAYCEPFYGKEFYSPAHQ